MPSVTLNGASARTCAATAPGRVRAALDVIGVALIGLYLGVFVVRNVSMQHDFTTYIVAAKAAAMGLDPYRSEVLSSLAGKPVVPFIYPPVALAAFVPLSQLDPSIAAAVWIGLKIMLLAGLMFVWLRWFVPGSGLLPLALVTVFGWNEAALWDLRMGNVALIECGLLWAAFACIVAGRRTAFAALVVACACFKLLPAVFLLLLLVPVEGASPSPRRLLAAMAAIALLVAGPMLVGPASHWERFFHAIPDARTLGEGNPGVLGFVTVVAQYAGLAISGASYFATWAWAAYALVLLGVSGPFLRRVWRGRDARTCVMAAVFLYVLLEPRPMAYGFILMAPAALFLAPRMFRTRSGQLLLALALSAQGFTRTTNQQPDAVLYIYAPALLALGVWLLILESDSREGRRSSAEVLPAAAAHLSLTMARESAPLTVPSRTK